MDPILGALMFVYVCVCGCVDTRRVVLDDMSRGVK